MSVHTKKVTALARKIGGIPADAEFSLTPIPYQAAGVMTGVGFDGPRANWLAVFDHPTDTKAVVISFADSSAREASFTVVSPFGCTEPVWIDVAHLLAGSATVSLGEAADAGPTIEDFSSALDAALQRVAELELLLDDQAHRNENLSPEAHAARIWYGGA